MPEESPFWDCRGVHIRFPFQPYAVQRKYIDTFVQAVQESQDALLESPTGTGKTLCILAGFLAVREHLCSRTEGSRVIRAGETPPYRGVSGLRLIYFTRTHQQASQVLKELQKLPYLTSTAILASRHHYCINQHVVGMDNLSARCQMQQRVCSPFHAVDGASVEPSFETDLEDFKGSCEETGVCPYYLARSHALTADIVVAPYPYLLGTTGLDVSGLIKDCVVVIDEGHNMEGAAIDSAEVELSEANMGSALVELDSLAQLLDSQDQEHGDRTNILTPASLMALRGFLTQLMLYMRSSPLVKPIHLSSLLSTLADMGLTISVLDNFCSMLRELVVKYLEHSLSTGSPGSAFLLKLDQFLQRLKVITDCPEHINFFRAVVLSEKQEDMFGSVIEARRLALWAVTPAVTLSRIFKHEPRAFVLTSGTLAPLKTLESLFARKFPVQLEGAHVIQPSQVFATVCPTVTLPSGRKFDLDFSYYNRTREPLVWDALVHALSLLLSRCPEGALIFVPSYAFLQQVQDSIGNCLGSHCHCMFEARTQDACKEQIVEYATRISRGESAALFSVFRGRLSEGIDFRDGLCRLVVLVGVPFPNVTDPHIKLRREYVVSELGSQAGQHWLQDQALRALNQGAGRAIRHSTDWGGMVFLSSRVSRFKAGISKWIRSILQLNSVEAAALSFASFCQQHEPVSIRIPDSGSGSSLKRRQRTAARSEATLATAQRGFGALSRGVLPLRGGSVQELQPAQKLARTGPQQVGSVGDDRNLEFHQFYTSLLGPSRFQKLLKVIALFRKGKIDLPKFIAALSQLGVRGGNLNLLINVFPEKYRRKMRVAAQRYDC